MTRIRRLLCLLVIITPAAALPGEANRDDGNSIAVTAGETVYFQLTRSTTLNQESPAIRVDNPGRDYSVVKATLEVGADGARTLKVRNGYENGLLLQVNSDCAAGGPDPRALVQFYIFRPGAEESSPMPASSSRVLLCNFKLTPYESAGEARPYVDSLMQKLRSMGQPDAAQVDIAGFQVDTSRASAPSARETLETLRYQAGIVESAKLPAEVLEFFRSVPIVIDPTLTGMNGQYAQLDGRWVVRARVGTWPQDRAILLHELLHAYLLQVLGQPTPDIRGAYQRARQPGVYPPDHQDAYFLSKVGEFFAVTGEIYLAGPSFRPPYSCANMQKAQPQYIAYLASLFGEHECR